MTFEEKRNLEKIFGCYPLTYEDDVFLLVGLIF